MANLRESFRAALEGGIIPVLPMETVGGEEAFELYRLRETHLFSGFNAQAAVAAQFSTVRLGSERGQVAVIRRIRANSNTAGNLILAPLLGPAATPIIGTFLFRRDLRELINVPVGSEIRGAASTRSQGSNQLGAVSLTGAWKRVAIPANTDVEFDLNCVLFNFSSTRTGQTVQNFQMQMSHDTANTTLNVDIDGYERNLEESEMF